MPVSDHCKIYRNGSMRFIYYPRPRPPTATAPHGGPPCALGPPTDAGGGITWVDGLGLRRRRPEAKGKSMACPVSVGKEELGLVIGYDLIIKRSRKDSTSLIPTTMVGNGFKWSCKRLKIE